MRVLPILFNTEMVRAILDGRKTCTRRILNPRYKEDEYGFQVCKRTVDPNKWGNWYVEKVDDNEMSFDDTRYINPPYCPGDILYVRETWKIEEYYGDEALIVFKAKGHKELYFEENGELDKKFDKFVDKKGWQPSLFMPKETARIWLKVKDVRVERLQDITEEQTEEEGFEFTPPCLSMVSEESYCDLDGPCTSKIKYCDMSSGELFGKVLWNSTIKKVDIDRYGWNANPYVWVIEFERCEKPERWCK